LISYLYISTKSVEKHFVISVPYQVIWRGRLSLG